MTTLAVLDLLLRYGPSAVAMGQKLAADIAAGKGQQTVTPEDWAELTRLSKQTAADIYAAAGIALPANSR